MNTHDPSRRCRRALPRLSWLTAVILGAGLVPALAQVLPSGFTTPSGGVSASTSGSTMTITQSQQRGIAHWNDFSIGAGGTVNVVQPNANSVLLNRVTGAGVSSIDGALNANGHVFLVNPNGILFGANARVDVGSIVASTLDLAGSTQQERDARFLAGGTLEFVHTGTAPAAVRVAPGATLQARGDGGAGGLVALMSDQVQNAGRLEAVGGTVALGAGSTVELDPVGDGLTTLRVTAGALGDGAGVFNAAGGEIAADGGRAQLVAHADWGAAVNQHGLVRARGLRVRGGEILLDAGNGSVRQDGLLDAGGDGAVGGGRVDVRGATVELGARSTIRADGGDAGGDGGRVLVKADGHIGIDGALSARSGAGGGDGGLIETSGVTFTIGSAFGVDASAASGRSGEWILDPENMTIAHGPVMAPSAPPNTIYDNDISAQLNGGTSVTVQTPAGGSSSGGNVHIENGVRIARTAAGAPVTFRVEADQLLYSEADVQIRSDGPAGALNVELIADAGNNGPTDGMGQVRFDGQIHSNGGQILVAGNWGSSTAMGAGVLMNGAILDSRADAVAGRADGSIEIRGSAASTAFDPVLPGDNGRAAVDLINTQIRSGTGSLGVSGASSRGAGVSLTSDTVLSSTTGPVQVTGLGTALGPSPVVAAPPPGIGVLLDRSSISSSDGYVAVYGRVDSAAAAGIGVAVVNGAQIRAGRDLDLLGSATGAGIGLGSQGATAAPTEIAAGNNATVRAWNDGTTDALMIGPGSSVRADSMLNLRPGALEPIPGGATVVLVPQDVTAGSIDLGQANGAGFAISADEFTRLSADTVVVGSEVHGGAIRVTGAVGVPYALTLHNGAGNGGIVVDAPLSAPRLGLVSGGDVTQSAAGAVASPDVLVQSVHGDVTLGDADNDAGALAGSAGGNFSWVDANPVTIRPVTVAGAASKVNAPQALTASTLDGNQVLVQTRIGDLTLAMPVNGASGTDLVAAARFQNPGSGSIAGAPWHVWADTWEGETRGGMAGSGPLPNLYGCSFAGPCDISVSPGFNQFVYAQRPTVTVRIDDATRLQGEPNPPLGLTLSGLRPGDSADAIHGVTVTDANEDSLPGVYAIRGDYSSDAGYNLDVVPGKLTVLDRFPHSHIPRLELPHDSTTYDGNLGGAPICLASAPLDGDRADVEGDVLAREWSRVRVRPRLTSCIDSSRRNACSDF